MSGSVLPRNARNEDIKDSSTHGVVELFHENCGVSLNPITVLGVILRKVAHALIKRYYPKIQITGAEHIPRSGPVLFCANHPNSLIDPVLIGITARRPVSFMAKAPLFNTPLLGSVMKALGMVPAYRGQDDARQVKKNAQSLGRVADGLRAGRAMGIFPEGMSTDVRQLAMVRSGAARIVLPAFAEGIKELMIVPLGINYESKQRLGSKVWMNVGRPISIQQFVATYEQEQEGTVDVAEDKVLRRKLTAELELRLKEVVVHLDNSDWDPLLTDLESIVQRSGHRPSVSIPALMRRKRISDAINYFYREDAETVEGMIAQVQAYHEKIRRAGLVIDDPVLNRSRPIALLTLLWQFVVLVAWFLPALFGLVMNLVPFVVTRTIARKYEDGARTMATWRLAFGIPIYLAWYGLVDLAILFTTGRLPLAGMMNLLLPLTGTIALRYWPFFVRSLVHLGHQFRTLANRGQLHALREELDTLREVLVDYAERFAEVSARPNLPVIKPLMMVFAKGLGKATFLLLAFLFYLLVYLGYLVLDPTTLFVAS
jgi:1-acyl-sn-glycerol-3-phosphate acyltransferase